MSKQLRPMFTRAQTVVEQLRPQLNELERERVALSEQTRRQLIIIAVASLITALLLRIILGSGWGGVAFLALVAGAVLAAWQLMRRQKHWEQRVLDSAIPVICESLGEIAYQATASVRDFLPAFEKLGLVGASNKRQLRHHFCGRHEKTGFEFVEADLERSSGGSRRNRDSSTIVFQGLLFRIQLPYSVDQRLLIGPRSSIDLINKRADMSELTFGDPAFDEAFVVHHEMNQPDAPALAEQLLTPAFRQALLELRQQEGELARNNGTFVIGLMYDSLYMAMTRLRKRGAVGKIQFKSSVAFLNVRFFMRSESQLEETVAGMVEEVATVYRVIDRLPLAG